MAFAVVPSNNVFPTCDSYIVNRDVARRLLEGFSPVRMSANKQLTFACHQAGIVSMYSVPNIFLDGSKVGRFVSCLQANNRLVYNMEYMKGVQTLNKGGNASDVRMSIDELNASGCREHPDVLFIRALLHARLSEYEAAQECFRAADDAYVKNGAIVQGDSEFLRAYIANFKHLQ